MWVVSRRVPSAYDPGMPGTGLFEDTAARVRAGVSRSLDLLLPPLCLTCGTQVGDHGALCAACWRGLDFIEAPVCAVTGLPFPFDPGPGAVSAAAVRHPPAYSQARAVVRYNAMSGRLIHKFKYGDRTDVVTTLARWMMRAGAPLIEETDVIAPVPLHRLRLWQRRFNQSAEIAREIGKLSGRPVVSDLLRRVRATPSQVGLSPDARRRNVAGAFALSPGHDGPVRGRSVLLVDDVLTTGATVDACARVLSRHRVRAVNVLTFARVVPGAETNI